MHKRAFEINPPGLPAFGHVAALNQEPQNNFLPTKTIFSFPGHHPCDWSGNLDHLPLVGSGGHVEHVNCHDVEFLRESSRQCRDRMEIPPIRNVDEIHQKGRVPAPPTHESHPFSSRHPKLVQHGEGTFYLKIHHTTRVMRADVYKHRSVHQTVVT